MLDALSALTNEATVKTVAVATVGLCVAAVVVPRYVAAARESSRAAGVSPLWILVPFAAFAFLILSSTEVGNQQVALALVGVQWFVSAWIVYRHRRWPWIALPLALALAYWPAALIAAIALGSMAH